MKTCNKEKFDKKTAKTILNQCKKEHRKECRIYTCDICEGGVWHLTSQETYEEVQILKLEELTFCEKWKELQKESP